MSKPGKPSVDKPGCGGATLQRPQVPGEAGIISHEGG
jgi:hypothetical protein